MTIVEETTLLADVPMYLEVELDRRMMTVREILELEAGSIVKMMRSAGENTIIFAGGAFLGSGEIVIIEETAGVRITDFNEET